MTDYTNELDLTARQSDYAIFLPALSTFYALFVGRQRRGLEPLDETRKGSGEPYIPLNRIPSHLTHGVESINWLAKEGMWRYKWSLHSAGHASLDLQKDMYRESQYRERDREYSWLLGDSGGFQIGKGKWEGDWRKGSGCKQAEAKRKGVLKWMDAFMDYGMILDIPAWVSRSPEGAKASKISSYQEAVEGTQQNNEYFINNRTGACKFLNVLQGENHADADDWYQQMKDYCDPKKYTDHFNGWSMGGQNMCDIHLALKRLVALRFDGLLEKGKHDFMHFLGTSKLEWATLLTDVQRAVRKYHNENFTITFDCASPFLATANGQIYIQTETQDRTKWVYRMVPSVDDKKYATDTRLFKDAVLQDNIFKNFEDSPLTENIKVKDVCIYKPGDVNKIGKEGKTSWDSFSYAIQMGHNVWSHINAVQQANRKYDEGILPAMLVDESFDRVYFRDVVEAIFATDNRDEANAVIEEFNKFWMSIIGTRGAVGKKTVNATTQFGNLFEEV